MSRIMVPNDDGTNGYFNPDKIREEFTESTSWDGQNWLGVCSGMQINRGKLMLTAGGRWVRHDDRRPEFNGPDSYVWLTDNEARDWLMRSADGKGADAEEAADAIERLWPDTPEESGPSKGGRPPVGPQITVAYPEDLLARVDTAAKEEGLARAEWLRRAAKAALDS